MALPAVGTFYLNPVRSGVRVWTQPGGPGTQVFPAQPQGEHAALYALICAHWINCLEVFEQYDPVTKQQAAILCCPMCSTVQRIIIPYANYENYQVTPIVVA
jgi:hypothetical protein